MTHETKCQRLNPLRANRERSHIRALLDKMWSTHKVSSPRGTSLASLEPGVGHTTYLCSTVREWNGCDTSTAKPELQWGWNTMHTGGHFMALHCYVGESLPTSVLPDLGPSRSWQSEFGFLSLYLKIYLIPTRGGVSDREITESLLF